MRLRDLPTEGGAAEALLRAEELERRRSELRGVWYPFALAGIAVTTLVVILLPIPTQQTCSLWRAEAAPTGSRALALTVPLIAAALVLVERMLPESGRIRAVGAAALGCTTLLAWLALLSQGRPGCRAALPATAVLVLGGLATATAAWWARRPPATRPRLIGDEHAGQHEPELNQPEIRAAYSELDRMLTPPPSSDAKVATPSDPPSALRPTVAIPPGAAVGSRPILGAPPDSPSDPRQTVATPPGAAVGPRPILSPRPDPRPMVGMPPGAVVGPRGSILPAGVGIAAGVLLLSTVAPWRELVDPAALDPVGVTDSGLARAQLWEMSNAEGWPLAVAATALVAIAVAVTTVIPLRSVLLGRVRTAVLQAAAAGCGALVVTGLLAALLRSPARLPDGVGYRAAAGAWLALPAGIAVLGLGVAGVVAAVRRRQPGPGGWTVQLAAVIAALATGAAAGTFVPEPAGPAYRPDRTPGTAHHLFELDAGQLTDRMGLRLAITTADPLASVAPALDGSPGLWLMARTSTDESTVFALVDGIALPRTKLHHGSRQPVLLGVSADRLVLLAGSAVLDKPWALLAVPLRLPSADVSLEQRGANGDLYVTPGVGRLAGGAGRIQVRRTADGSVLLWDEDETWHVPAGELTTGDRLELERLGLNLRPGGAGNPADIGPDGSTVWSAGSRGGLFVAWPGRPARLLTGTAPGDCPVSSDPAAAGLPTDRFAIDALGNVWLAGDDRVPAVVVTPDGVTREVPGVPGLVVGIEAHPDGTVWLAVSPGGGDQILEINGAATAASAYQAAPEPEPRCAPRGGIRPAMSFDAVRLPQPRTVGTPVAEDGGSGLPSASSPVAAQLMLDTGGELVRRRLPESVGNWAPDGHGGVWWGRYGMPEGTNGPRPFTAVHLPAGRHTATAIEYPVPVRTAGQQASSAAYGDRFISTLDAGGYGVFGPGRRAGRLAVAGRPRTDGLAMTGTGQVAMVIDGRLVEVGTDGRQVALFGGSTEARWPIAAALASGVPAATWSTDGQWFGGPDGRLWGYDGQHLYRVDGPGRVVVLGGPAQSVPAAADRVTVIGGSLYLETGLDVVRLTPRSGSR